MRMVPRTADAAARVRSLPPLGRAEEADFATRARERAQAAQGWVARRRRASPRLAADRQGARAGGRAARRAARSRLGRRGAGVRRGRGGIRGGRGKGAAGPRGALRASDGTHRGVRGTKPPRHAPVRARRRSGRTKRHSLTKSAEKGAYLPLARPAALDADFSGFGRDVPAEDAGDALRSSAAEADR